MSEQEFNALRDALASARMEDLPVTAQTEADCARLLNGEISLDALVQELLSRPVQRTV